MCVCVYVYVCVCYSLEIENMEAKEEKFYEAVDETGVVTGRGYPKKNRTRSWKMKGFLSFFIHVCVYALCMCVYVCVCVCCLCMCTCTAHKM